MTFADEMRDRSASVYADFALPLIPPNAKVLDVGAGSGTISVGIAIERSDCHVTATDVEDGFAAARAHCEEHGVTNITFETADAQTLPYGDETFDVVFCHSMLEVARDPVLAVSEMHRVLRPGGAVAVASVEYGGMIRSGPGDDLLDRFFQIRESLWGMLDPPAHQHRGRQLRSYLYAAGFTDVDATATYLSYGTEDAVRTFGNDRAVEVTERRWRSAAISTGLASEDELEQIETAWRLWAESPDSFLAFAWCRATGRRAD